MLHIQLPGHRQLYGQRYRCYYINYINVTLEYSTSGHLSQILEMVSTETEDVQPTCKLSFVF